MPKTPTIHDAEKSMLEQEPRKAFGLIEAAKVSSRQIYIFTVVAFAAGGAQGARISLFPFLSLEKAGAGDETRRQFDVLGPLLDAQSTSMSTEFTLHPIIHYAHSPDVLETDIIYPLFSYSTKKNIAEKETTQRNWLLPLYWHSGTKGPGGNGEELRVVFPVYYAGSKGSNRGYVIIFPFYWRGKNTRIYFPITWVHDDSSFFALWPLFGRFEKLWGLDEISFVLWPFLIHSRRSDDHRWSLFYPFFAFMRGPDSLGFRVWPLFEADRWSDGRERQSFLWPLFTRNVTRDKETWSTKTLALPFYAHFRESRRSLDYVFPFYGHVETQTYTTRFYLWPLYTRTVTKKTNEVLHEFLWNFLQFGSGANRSVARIFPLFEIEKRKDRDSLQIAWPFFTRRVHHHARYDFHQSFLLPFWIDNERRYPDEKSDVSQVLAPLYRYRADKDGPRDIQSLWPFWMVAGPALERTWEPLFEWLHVHKAPNGDGETRLLGRLYRRETVGGQTRRYIELLGLRLEISGRGVTPRFLVFPE